MITGLESPDGVILVVDATVGPTAQTREQVRLARQVDVPRVVVFLNKCDLFKDAGPLDALEATVRALLEEYDFAVGLSPIVRGSAVDALGGKAEGQILALTDALDSLILVHPAVDQPFLMAVEDVSVMSGRGTVATGRIERGSVHTAQSLEIVGLRGTTATTCTGVVKSGKMLDEAEAGEDAGVILRGIKRDDVEPGQVLATVGSVTPHTKFTTLIYMLTPDEKGRTAALSSGYRAQFSFRTADVTGTVELPDGVASVSPGGTAQLEVTLAKAVVMEVCLRFAIHARTDE